MAKILVIGKIKDQGFDVFRSRPEFTVEATEESDPAIIKTMVGDCDAILVRTSLLTAEVIDAAPNLKVISRHGVGYDNIDLEVVNRRKIALAISATSNRTAVAEHALFMMLDLAKRSHAYDRATRSGHWSMRNGFSAFELSGKSLLLAGFGRIGAEVAKRAKAFDMRIMVFDPYVGDDSLDALGCERVAVIETALPEADFVSLHLPLSEQTRNIIDASALASMKPSSVLINTARGGLIDEAALKKALDEGQILAAGIDVFEQEPPPQDHPLFESDKVLLSPHSAGLTEEATIRMAVEAAQNIINVLDGHLDPQMIVNLEAIQSPP